MGHRRAAITAAALLALAAATPASAAAADTSCTAQTARVAAAKATAAKARTARARAARVRSPSKRRSAVKRATRALAAADAAVRDRQFELDKCRSGDRFHPWTPTLSVPTTAPTAPVQITASDIVAVAPGREYRIRVEASGGVGCRTAAEQGVTVTRAGWTVSLSPAPAAWCPGPATAYLFTTPTGAALGSGGPIIARATFAFG
jgi:hypothetical protein